MRNLRNLLLSTLLAVSTHGLSNTISVTDFGATGDGKTIETQSLQAAIDSCANAGGGTVRIPAGDFVTGTIILKSNVTLSLDHGASLLGSPRLEDYPTDGLIPAREGNSECLLYAGNATNIRIQGLGTIDGRGKPDIFPRSGKDRKRLPRPRLLRFENCSNVTLSGLTYRDPAFWGLHLVDCRNVRISSINIRFRNNHYNNDGIDIDACENVLIENSDINAGDDAICLKSTKGPCRNITVRDCIVSSNTAALKFGTSSSGGFINVNVSNCHFFDCPMGAIKLQIVDGGRMENINISRITMDEVGSPIFIRLGNRGRSYSRETHTGPNTGTGTDNEGNPAGSIKGIRISDVVATVTIEDREKAARAHYKKLMVDPSPEPTDKEIAKAGPIMIAGIPGHPIEDVVLENIQISYPGNGRPEYSERQVPEDIARYPEQYFFGPLPAWGAYIRHAKDITFKNVTMSTRRPDPRDMIVLDDVQHFQNL